MSTQKSQFGRSLVEMILVIALIGLLTIGGIAGYNALATRTESRTVAETITRHVIQRRHEAMTKKGLQENLKANIEGPHGVLFDISNDVGSHLIVVTTKGQNSDLIKALSKSDVLKFEAYSIDEPVITDEESSVVMKFLQNRPNDTTTVEPESGTEPSEPVTQTCTNHSDCPAGTLCESETCSKSCNVDEICDSCPEKTPVWHEGKCICQGTSCGEKSYCDADGVCQECPENAVCSTGIIQCNEGYEGEDCSACVTDGSETCDSCATETPCWNGEECVSAICPENSSTEVIEGQQIGTTGCYCK